MAIKDVKQYYYTMQAQYMEMQSDLADFEQAFVDGYITEDQLATAREEIDKLKVNYDRLTYIMYLLEIPNRPRKKVQHARASKDLQEFFTQASASSAEVELENRSALAALRKELNRLNSIK